MEVTSMKPDTSQPSFIPCSAALRRGPQLVVAAVVTLLLCLPVLAQEASGAGNTAAPAGPAIPPGQEELLLEMLGMGAALPDCELVDGQVNFTVITATYGCTSGEVTYDLSHRSKADRNATPTDQFAITLTSGSPPRGFSDALVSLVRSREAEFEWMWPGDNDPQ
jgi:hypothetical protein